MLNLSALGIALLVLLIFSAFFSASEAALIALNKVRLRHLVEQRRRGARRVLGLVHRMDQMIATLLVGNNLVNTAIASISTILCVEFFGAGKALVLVTVVMTVILVIFGELTPKILATNHPEGVSFMGRHALSFLILVLRPITATLTGISNGLIRLFGGNPHYRQPLVTEEEMKMMITIGREEGFYGDTEKKMLERIFHFDEVEVRDVMTPLEDMTAIPVDIKEEELERVVLEEGHNRIPVYRDKRSNVIGILYVRDIVYLIKNAALIRIEDVMSAPLFVGPRQKVNELLREFQRRKLQIAIVRDPKTDGAVGLVTLEDLVEEIVGELEEADKGRK